MATTQERIRWSVFLCIAAALVATVKWPFRQPITPSPSVEAVYDYLNELPPDSTILLAADYDPQAKAELQPMTEALLKHCFRRGIRVVGMTFWLEGAPFHTRIFEQEARRYGKVAGTDYVYLGFKPGTMAQVITNMGESMQSAFPQDAGGRPTAPMRIFRDVKTLRDFQYIIDLAAGNTVDGWIIYGGDKYGVPMAAGCTAVVGPDLYVYTNTGQLTGIVAGLRGAADYEVLLGEHGAGVAGMPAQSAAHAVIVISVVLSNVLYFLLRERTSARTGQT